MGNILAKLPRLVLPFWAIFFGVLLLMLYGAVIIVVASCTTGQTVAWQGQCDFQNYDGNGEKAALVVKCGDEVKYVTSSAVVVGYMKKPGPLSCQISGLGGISCTPNS